MWKKFFTQQRKKEGTQDFDEDEVIVAGAPGQNTPQAQIVVAAVNVPVPVSAAALKKLKKDQLYHQLTICGVIFEKAKSKSELSFGPASKVPKLTHYGVV